MKKIKREKEREVRERIKGTEKESLREAGKEKS